MFMLIVCANIPLATERSRNPHGCDERWKGCTCLIPSTRHRVIDAILLLQLPIKAGHEFTISTEDKYSEICDDKILWLDYVRWLIRFFVSYLRKIAEKLAEGHCSWQAHLH